MTVPAAATAGSSTSRSIGTTSPSTPTGTILYRMRTTVLLPRLTHLARPTIAGAAACALAVSGAALATSPSAPAGAAPSQGSSSNGASNGSSSMIADVFERTATYPVYENVPDDDHLATANEGDWKGGSRGWTVWDTSGNVVWDASTQMEELAARYGLHNEDRAGKKGPGIEGLAVAAMNGTRYAFVASERSNFVAVYDVDDPADASTLYAASDSALAEGRVYTIDASQTPARIVRARSVTEEGTAASGLDIEGLDARAGGGGFWLASEGATDAGNEIIRTDSRLAIQERVSLPAEVTDHVGKWGLEGIDSAVNAKGEEVVYVALQRPLWVDPSAKPLEALEGATTNRIGRYNTVTGE